MADAYIFNNFLNSNDLAAIELAVKAAGFDPVYGVPANVSLIDPAKDIGIVGLPVDARDVAGVNAAMLAFAKVGIRVVCIWLHNDEGDGTGVPVGADRYGSATIRIGSSELEKTLKGESDVWEGPDGAPHLPPVTKRNKC